MKGHRLAYGMFYKMCQQPAENIQRPGGKISIKNVDVTDKNPWQLPLPKL